MSTQNTKLEAESQKAVDFKDLEGLLRKSLNNKDLKVVDYTSTKLLPPGENYCSIMVKLEVKLRKNKSAKEETLHLVAKTPSCTERPIVDWSLVFQKELFMYAELRPLYRQLEREVGIEESELIDVWPEYVGYRNSLKGDDIIDDDSALIMKNIKIEGFYNGNRFKGLDIHHCRLALRLLARYHALGIAMKQKRPEFAEKAANQGRILGIDFDKIDEGLDSLRQTFVENAQLHKHLPTIMTSFDGIMKGKVWMTEPIEPWAVVSHGDFWTNNILFHKDDKGNVDDVKFVDFQTYLYCSPLNDLPYFICGSLDKEAQQEHVEELVDLYYDAFVKHLRRLNCDHSLFTKQSFKFELKNRAVVMFPIHALAIKFFAYENDDENRNNEEMLNTVFDAKPSDVFIEKLQGIIKLYEKIGWF